MLPVPYDQPLAPLYTYEDSNPPAVPAIQVHPDGLALIVPAAAAVANKLSEAATASTTRMFCYNLVSLNNWNNSDFAHLVRLVVDYAVYKSYSAGGNIYVILNQVADEFASLYASYLATVYNEYFIQLDPSTQHRIMQNVQLYNEFSAKADSVYNLAPQAPQQHGVHRGQNMAMVMNRPQAHHGMHRHNTGYHYPAHTVQGGHRNVGANPAASALIHHSRPTSRDNIIATKFGTVPRATRVETHNNQGGNMDQDLHRIAYRGNTITAHVGGNTRKVTPKANSLNTQKQVKQNQGGELRHVFVANDLDKEIDIVDIIEPEIQTAFGTVEAMMSSKLKRSVLELHPFVSLAVIPLISSTKTDTLHTILREARTFTAVSAALKKYKDILNAMDESKADDQYFGNVWLKKVDNFITGHANRYFQSVLPNGGFTTTSVMEDGAELALMIDKNYGRAALNSFNQFQKNLFSIMFQSDAHTVDSIPELETGDTKVVDYEIFTLRTLIVYLTVTWDELSGGMKTIRQVVTKDSEGRLKEALTRIGMLAKNINVTRMYVMLSDGIRLAVFEDATEPGTFKITEE